MHIVLRNKHLSSVINSLQTFTQMLLSFMMNTVIWSFFSITIILSLKGRIWGSLCHAKVHITWKTRRSHRQFVILPLLHSFDIFPAFQMPLWHHMAMWYVIVTSQSTDDLSIVMRHAPLFCYDVAMTSLSMSSRTKTLLYFSLEMTALMHFSYYIVFNILKYCRKNEQKLQI